MCVRVWARICVGVCLWENGGESKDSVCWLVCVCLCFPRSGKSPFWHRCPKCQQRDFGEVSGVEFIRGSRAPAASGRRGPVCYPVSREETVDTTDRQSAVHCTENSRCYFVHNCAFLLCFSCFLLPAFSSKQISRVTSYTFEQSPFCITVFSRRRLMTVLTRGLYLL